jgi:hypothetical protein
MQVQRKTQIIVATAALGCAIAIAGTVQRAAAAGDDVSPTDQYKVIARNAMIRPVMATARMRQRSRPGRAISAFVRR